MIPLKFATASWVLVTAPCSHHRHLVTSDLLPSLVQIALLVWDQISLPFIIYHQVLSLQYQSTSGLLCIGSDRPLYQPHTLIPLLDRRRSLA